MIWMPLLALILGVLIAWWLPTPSKGVLGNYLSVAALAGMDTIIGGMRAALERSFDRVVFASGFAVNMITAAGLAYFGDQIGLDLFLAAVVVLGGRIFVNLSLIRRHLLSRVETNGGGDVSAPPAADPAGQ